METDDILARLGDVIRDSFERPDLVITAESSALDVDGWDSLAHTVLIMQVEKAFGLKLPRQRIFALRNVGDLAQLIRESLATGR